MPKLKIELEFDHPYIDVFVVITEDKKKWARDGECKRCGKCCNATKYACDRKNNECVNYWRRPFGCAIYPFDPSKGLEKDCGFSWREIKNG